MKETLTVDVNKAMAWYKAVGRPDIIPVKYERWYIDHGLYDTLSMVYPKWVTVWG